MKSSQPMADVPAFPRYLADWMIQRGHHWITLPEAAKLLGLSEAAAPATLARLRDRGLLFSPTPGAYAPVPPEFRDWGALPASHFIDPLMRSLGHPYYVGMLSAAESLGVAHQHPQVFQVVTTARLRGRRFGRVRLQFVTSRHAAERPTRTVNTPTGTMAISTPEVTALDLVQFPACGAGLSNVCTVLGDMLDEKLLDLTVLAGLAPSYPRAVRQRAGWLLERAAGDLETDVDLSELRATATVRTAPALLNPSRPRRGGTFDASWNLIVNANVESDL
jgi:predicted transcriptional regulator of viral defense system